MAGPAAILSWVIGAILLIGIALVYSELGVAYPMSGSTARFTWIHSGTLAGSSAGPTPTFSRRDRADRGGGLTRLPERQWYGLQTSAGLLTGKGLVVGVAAMFLFTALNLIGVKWMAEGNTIAMIWKILVPVATVILIISYRFHSANAGFFCCADCAV